MERLRVAVRASDPVSESGLLSYLSTRSDLVASPLPTFAEPDVAVATADRLTSRVLNRLRHDALITPVPTVLVTGDLSGDDILTVVECQVVSILPPSAVTEDVLVRSVLTAASGGGLMPPHLVGALIGQVRRLQREVLVSQGITVAGILQREVDVLRLVADGCDTKAIANKLGYAERTVTSILQAVIHKLGVRNRPHAVAHALRAGVI
jgi:DNA-binding NarL/FixJ family response regulator